MFTLKDLDRTTCLVRLPHGCFTMKAAFVSGEAELCFTESDETTKIVLGRDFNERLIERSSVLGYDYYINVDARHE